jgi:membrane protease YdiL (CAAX protease family)
MLLTKLRQALHSLGSPNAFVAQGRLGRTGWPRALASLALGPLLVGALVGVRHVVDLVRHAPVAPADAAAVAARVAHDPSIIFVGVLIVFGALLAGLVVGTRFIQRRPISSLVHVVGRPFRWRRWLLGLGLTLGFNALSALLVHALAPAALVWSFAPHAFVSMLPWAVASLTVQTLAEEVLFRGWLPQTLAGPRQRVGLAVTLSGLIFFAMHLGNPEMSLPGALPAALVAYLTLSALLGIVALREEGLELAWGVHLANNLACVLLVGMPGGTLPSVALFQEARVLPWVDTAQLLLLAALVLLSLRRRPDSLVAGPREVIHSVR